MAEQGIEITLKGFKEFQGKIKQGRVKLSNGSKLHARIGINLLKLVDKGFKSEGAAVAGKKWKSLAKSTIASRRKGGGTGGPRILQDKGILRQSFTMKAKNNEVRVGTAIKYAEVHEKGGKKSYIIRPKNKKSLKFISGGGKTIFSKSVKHPPLVQRKMLPKDFIAQRLITKTYNNFVQEQLKKTGLK